MHRSRREFRVRVLLGCPHEHRSPSLAGCQPLLLLQLSLGPQEAHSPGVAGGKWGAVTAPCLAQTLLCFEPSRFLSPRSLCLALQVYREDHGGDGAVVSSGHHPTLCQQPRSGSAHLPCAELQQAGARPAKPPAPLLVSPHLASIPKEGGFSRKVRCFAKTLGPQYLPWKPALIWGRKPSSP